jgi:alpha-methylacyl-CoA racemase
MLPLAGIKVLDFSTLLPGPLAGLLLAEAGADVIKIERPGIGDEMRTYEPKLGADSANFVLLNRGKGSVAIDLKAPDAIARLTPLIESADVLIEQFRPGVMARLGLGFDALSRINPRLIYCSITGFGQTGPRRDMAGHDLNYLALAGLLSLTADASGTPGMPHAPIADIAGGSYPAVINILLALLQRQQTGRGSYLDIAMTDNLFLLAYWGLANGFTAGDWPKAGANLTTGGSPRYQIYRTADGRFLAAAPLEQKFWDNFCAAIELDAQWRDDARDPSGTRAAVAQCIASRSAAAWREVFAGKDVCCAVVASVEEALSDAHFQARGLFARQLAAGGRAIAALPVPVDAAFRGEAARGYPELGEDNALLGG